MEVTVMPTGKMSKNTYRKGRIAEKNSERKMRDDRKILVRLRNTTVIFLILITLQFWLGMSINLELNLPVKHLPPISSLIYYASHFGFILVHVLNGSLLLVVSFLYLFSAVISNFKSLKVIGVIGTVSVVGAVINGILFLMSGQFFGWSIGMAMSAVSALLTYSVGLYFIGIELGRKRGAQGIVDHH